MLCFGGVKSAFRCWVNGAYAGFGKGSMLPVEFDVTALLHPGENTLAVEVRAFSDAVYLEDQDMWHMAGIYRDVTLRMEPPCALLDVYAKADSDGSLRIETETRGGDAVRARLRDGESAAGRGHCGPGPGADTGLPARAFAAVERRDPQPVHPDRDPVAKRRARRRKDAGSRLPPHRD